MGRNKQANKQTEFRLDCVVKTSHSSTSGCLAAIKIWPICDRAIQILRNLNIEDSSAPPASNPFNLLLSIGTCTPPYLAGINPGQTSRFALGRMATARPQRRIIKCMGRHTRISLSLFILMRRTLVYSAFLLILNLLMTAFTLIIILVFLSIMNSFLFQREESSFEYVFRGITGDL